MAARGRTDNDDDDMLDLGMILVESARGRGDQSICMVGKLNT